MTIKKTKIELIFKNEYCENEYYHGKDFHNPNLKFLTPEKLSEIIKILIPSNSNKEIIEIPLDNFEYAYELQGTITKEQIENPTETLIPLYLKFISGTLSSDTMPHEGLTIEKLPKITSILTNDELIELLNHLTYPYFQWGEYYVGLTNLHIVETIVGNYFNWEVMYGDADHYDKGVTTFTTLDQTIDLGEFKTVKELKDLLDTLPQHKQLPQFTFRFKNMY